MIRNSHRSLPSLTRRARCPCGCINAARDRAYAVEEVDSDWLVRYGVVLLHNDKSFTHWSTPAALVNCLLLHRVLVPVQWVIVCWCSAGVAAGRAIAERGYWSSHDRGDGGHVRVSGVPAPGHYGDTK